MNKNLPPEVKVKTPKTKALAILVFMLIGVLGFAQSVTTIQPTVVGDKIHIKYTVTGLKYFQKVTKVRVYLTMGSKTYQAPLKMVSGDLEGISNGEHQIIWDAYKEFPLTDEAMTFEVKLTIEDLNKKKSWFVMLAGNDVTPLGIRLGQLNKTGWYAEFRGSLGALNQAGYSYDGSTVTDYNKPGYYEFSGTGKWKAYSAIVGVTQQMGLNIFIYGGVGYGVEDYIMELNEYDYTSETSTGNAWVTYDEYSNHGVEVDAGLIFRYKKLLISGGGTALNFKSYGWSVGLGLSF